MKSGLLLLLPLVLALGQTDGNKATIEEFFAQRAARLWSLQPVVKPEPPAALIASTNPIDAFLAADCKAQKLTPAGKADKITLLRRVYFDLIGIPRRLLSRTHFSLTTLLTLTRRSWTSCSKTSSMACAGRGIGWMC